MLEKLQSELSDAARQFPDYRPKITICRNPDNSILSGPEAIWYTANKKAFYRLEAISTDIIKLMQPGVERPNGWRKYPDVWEQGPRYNNAGRLLHWMAKNDLNEPTEFRMFRVEGEQGSNGTKRYSVEPLDNVFLLICKLELREAIQSDVEHYDKAKQDALDFKNDGHSWTDVKNNPNLKFKRDAIVNYAKLTRQVVEQNPPGRPSVKSKPAGLQN